MSELTAELNLVLCEDNDDTADYLTTNSGLSGSLSIIDGLFSSTTGHNHHGAHQGGNFSSLDISGDMTIGGNFTATGTLTALGAAHFPSMSVDNASTLGTLHVIGATTLSSTLTVASTLTVTGPTTLNGSLNTVNVAASGYVSAGTAISGSPGDLSAHRPDGTGYLYLGDGSHYLGFDGSRYQLPTSDLFVRGDLVILQVATQTLSNKTLAAPIIASPSLSGTVSGSATWASSQTFSAGINGTGADMTQDIAAGGSFFLRAAQNASLRASTRAGHNSAEVEIDNFLYVPGDIYAGTRMYAIQFVQTSDPRLKQSMSPIPDDDCMGRIRCPVPVQTYQLGDAWDIGFSAPDMAECSPEFVARDAEGVPAGLSYSNMSALLWGALRQLDARCQAKGI